MAYGGARRKQTIKADVRNRQVKSASGVCKKAYEAYPDNALILYSLVKLQAWRGQCERADGWAQRLRSLNMVGTRRKKVISGVDAMLEACAVRQQTSR